MGLTALIHARDSGGQVVVKPSADLPFLWYPPNHGSDYESSDDKKGQCGNDAVKRIHWSG